MTNQRPPQRLLSPQRRSRCSRRLTHRRQCPRRPNRQPRPPRPLRRRTRPRQTMRPPTPTSAPPTATPTPAPTDAPQPRRSRRPCARPTCAPVQGPTTRWSDRPLPSRPSSQWAATKPATGCRSAVVRRRGLDRCLPGRERRRRCSARAHPGGAARQQRQLRLLHLRAKQCRAHAFAVTSSYFASARTERPSPAVSAAPITPSRTVHSFWLSSP